MVNIKKKIIVKKIDNIISQLDSAFCFKEIWDDGALNFVTFEIRNRSIVNLYVKDTNDRKNIYYSSELYAFEREIKSLVCNLKELKLACIKNILNIHFFEWINELRITKSIANGVIQSAYTYFIVKNLKYEFDKCDILFLKELTKTINLLNQKLEKDYINTVHKIIINQEKEEKQKMEYRNEILLSKYRRINEIIETSFDTFE